MSPPAPISREAVRALAIAAVRQASTGAPGDASAAVEALVDVSQQWQLDWCTSIMGGGGGTGCYVEGKAILVSHQYLTTDWDFRLEWIAGRWQVTAENPRWKARPSDVDEWNAGELPLVDVFMAGLQFDEPNRYRR